MEHEKLSGRRNHTLVVFTYADAAERLSKVTSDFAPDDTCKVARQLSDNSYWLLKVLVPAVIWEPLAGSGIWSAVGIIGSDEIKPSEIYPSNGIRFTKPTGGNAVAGQPLGIELGLSWVSGEFGFGPSVIRSGVAIHFSLNESAELVIDNLSPAPSWIVGLTGYGPQTITPGYGLTMTTPDGSGNMTLNNQFGPPPSWVIGITGYGPSEINAGLGMVFTFDLGFFVIVNKFQRDGGQMGGTIDMNAHPVHNMSDVTHSGTLVSSAAAVVLTLVTGPGETDATGSITLGVRVVLTKDSGATPSGSIDVVADFEIDFDGSGNVHAGVIGAFSPDYSRTSTGIAGTVLTAVPDVNKIDFKIACPAADSDPVVYTAYLFTNHGIVVVS